MLNSKISKREMLSDIERILGSLDGAAGSLENNWHFEVKFFVDEMRKKYGIKTKTSVNVALIFDPRGRMTVDEYKRRFER